MTYKQKSRALVLWHHFSKFYQGHRRKQHYLSGIVKAITAHYDTKCNHIFKVLARRVLSYKGCALRRNATMFYTELVHNKCLLTRAVKCFSYECSWKEFCVTERLRKVTLPRYHSCEVVLGPEPSSRIGFLNLSTTDIWGFMLLCGGRLSCAL